MTKIKDVISTLMIAMCASAVIVFGLFYGIDAELAMRDRANGISPQGCIFDSNCD